MVACTGLGITGNNVFLSRVYPLQDGDLPGLRIFAREEATEPDTDGEMGDTEFRHLIMEVLATVKATALYDDTLDDICLEVEEALHGDATLNGHIRNLVLASSEFEFTDEEEVPLGTVTMLWVADYYVDRTSPTAPL